jgi:hypothetical protein
MNVARQIRRMLFGYIDEYEYRATCKTKADIRGNHMRGKLNGISF